MVDYVSTNALSMLGGDDYGDITADIAALDASVVHKTGNLNETINGVKTFTSDFVINNANTDIISSVGANISAPVVYLNGTQNRVGSSLAVGSTSVGNKIDCVGGYNLITSSTTSTLANLIEATNGGSNGMTTTGAGNNVLNAQGTGKNFLISQTNNNEIQAGNANLMLIGTTEKLNMTSNTTTLTNSQININSTVGNNTISANSGRNYIQTLGGDNFITTNSGTNNMTVSSGTNTISSSRTSAYGNVIRALGTGGGNSMTTASGQNLIESGGGGANLIQCLGGSARNTIYTTGTASNANFIDTFDGTGGNTIRASSGTNLISTATGQNKLLATGTVSSGAGNVLEVSAGDGGNVLKAIGTGTYGGGFNAIVGRNNYYDANPGGHFIRTGATGVEAVKISVYPTTTYMDNTNVVFTMGDQFTVNCFANRIYCSAGGFHNLRVNNVEKLVMSGTTTTLSNTTINIDASSLVALKIGGVQKIGSSSVSSTLNNQEIYITGSTLCYTEVNSKIRIYNQSDRNEYRFNPAATIPSSQVWRLYDNGTTNVLYLLQGTSALNGVYLANGANGWSGWSDERIKKNIKPIDTALTDILKLNPVFYNYKADDETLPERVGFIAQEVQQVYPDIVNESKMDSGGVANLLGLDMTNLVPYLVKAIQDLNKKLEEQALIIQELVLKTSSL